MRILVVDEARTLNVGQASDDEVIHVRTVEAAVNTWQYFDELWLDFHLGQRTIHFLLEDMIAVANANKSKVLPHVYVHAAYHGMYEHICDKLKPAGYIVHRQPVTVRMLLPRRISKLIGT